MELQRLAEELRANYDHMAAFVWLVAFGLVLAITVLYGVYYG